jgi:glycolate oxidase FAD binding subunit
MVDSKEIIDGLAEIIGRDFVKTKPEIVSEYAVDKVSPMAVLFPKNTQQVSEIVKLANLRNLAIVPRGSGSKMSFGNPPKRLDLVLCTTRMNHMLDVDTANLTITVEAGVKFRDVQARLATEDDRCYLPLEDLATEGDEFICSDRSHSGCFLPIDPPFSEKATMGGIVAANSNGPRRLLYNLLRDHMLGVRFVTPNGDIVGGGGKTVKNVSGYDISKLMIGSIGTLGIICEITFKLLPLPEQLETLLFSFKTSSAACDFADRIFETSLLPAAVEILNAAAFSNLKAGAMPDLASDEFVVAVALEAFEEAVERMSKDIRDMARVLGATETVRLQDHAHLQFWLAVSSLDAALATTFSGLIRAKLNYRISEWKSIIEFVTHTLAQVNLKHAISANAGCGICTVSLLMEQNSDGLKNKAVEVMGKMLEHSRQAGGNLVIQYAPDDMKKRLGIWGELPFDFAVMKRIKEQMDPSGMMSPGRFVDGL